MKHSELFAFVSEKLGYSTLPVSVKPCSGGCIHDTKYWEYNDGKRFFVKHAQSHGGENMLSTEKQALQLIFESNTIRCPKPFLSLSVPGNGYVLVMEYLELEGLDRDSGERLGVELANSHQVTGDSYGMGFDNYIGSTPQYNRQQNNWAEFFWTERIQFQLSFASKQGYSFRNTTGLEAAVFEILGNYNPKASLLHGDLWGGNAAALPDGTPVIFDPASYYGDSETDLAFTEVFGGFPGSFYDGYRSVTKIDDGYSVRKWIYNLYHYLNHLNLFGSGYLKNCENSIQTIIRSC